MGVLQDWGSDQKVHSKPHVNDKDWVTSEH